MVIDCKKIVNDEKEVIKKKVEKLHRRPHLCVIQVGDNPASNAYIRGKKNDCEEVGILFTLKKFGEDVTKEEIIQYMDSVIKMDMFTHMIVQLPIPFSKEDTDKIINKIPRYMDIDGLVKDSYYTPCTPLGVMKIFDAIDYDLAGKNVVLINRSDLVGKPLINLLLRCDATVIVCHSKTRNVEAFIKNADVVISAVGKKDFITADMLHDGQVVIDVGITRDEETGKICGDCSAEVHEMENVLSTKTPGGTGLLTRLSVLSNIVF